MIPELVFSMLAEQHPRDGKILVYLGNCLRLQGRTAKARAIYAKAILTSPWDMKLEGFTDKELVEDCLKGLELPRPVSRV